MRTDEQSKKSKRVFQNASWIIACRVAQSVMSLVIGMLSARYLGPANFGTINYAASVTAFAVPIMQLGLRNILVKEFVGQVDRQGEILGTALLMNSLSAILCMIGIFAFSSIANRNEPETIIVCVLYSLNLLFQALEMSQYWFQAKLLSRYTSLVSLIAYVVTSAYKIYLLASEKSLYWFAISYSLDYAIIAAALMLFYRKLCNQRLSVSFARGKMLLSVSKHYIVSNMLVTVFGYSGNILLKLLLDDVAVGYYSAAITTVAMTGFVYNAIIDSARPVIFESKQSSEESFQMNVVRLYGIIIFLSAVQCVLFSLLAPTIIHVLYGKDYGQAVFPLRVVVWQIPFSYIGMVRNIWILAEGKQRYLWIINLGGATVNILINCLLIPVLGVIGAAIAAVLTQFFTNIVLGFVLKPIRENNHLLMKGLNYRNLIETFKLLLVRN